MKEELQGKLVEILTSIQAATGKASDFAMAQLPDIAQSYVAYGRAIYTAAVLFAVLLLVVAFFLVRTCIRESRKDYKECNDFVSFASGFGGMASVFVGVMVGSLNLSAMVMVWLAPKVWLLKELAGMLK